MDRRKGTPLSATGDRARILYLSHNGLTEPLGRRQVLPYLVGLSARGWRFTAVSFEKSWTASPEEVAKVQEITQAAGIAWRPLRYHRRPPLLSTAFDVLQGWLEGRRCGAGAILIHARSTAPALMARLLSDTLATPWIFDLRGLVAEEYADAGHWRRGGLRYRMTATAERVLVNSADGLVTLTHRILDRLPSPGAGDSRRPTVVIPCSVDPEVFRPEPECRRQVRNELGWGDEPALVYSGSLGSWYRLTEMLDFFEAARSEIAGLRLLLLTPQLALAEDAVRARQLVGCVASRSVASDAVPRHLAAADAGICFLGRLASKDASSPTKYGEYLAAGLPVVTNSWIGDARTLADEAAWILVDEFEDAQYRQAAARLSKLLEEPETTRTTARALALREFAIDTAVDRYDALYREVLDRQPRAQGPA